MRRRLLTGPLPRARASRKTDHHEGESNFKIRNRATLIFRSESLRAAAKADSEKEHGKIFWPGGSPQPIEKAQSAKENQRKSKPFSLIFFAVSWPGLAGF
jgi:hypothetical protein